MRSASRIVALSLVFFSAAAAEAGPFDLYGFGARAIAMGGAATASADDHTAVFYNPANLVVRKKIHLGADFLITVPNLSIRLDGDPNRPNPVEANRFAGIGLGVLFPLGGKINYRLAFGMVLYIPTAHLLRIDALDPLVPRWYIWDSLADKLQIILGIGGQVTDWLSIGVGAQSLASIDGDVVVDVDPINETLPTRDINTQIFNTASPIAGLRLGPFYGLTFGFCWRAALAVEFSLPLTLDFGDAMDVLFVVKGDALYTPHTLSFGLGWQIPDTGWSLNAETRLALWSLAPDPSLQFEMQLSGEVIEAFGIGDALDFVAGPSAFPQLKDVWSLHVGGEVWATDHVVGRAGYSYRPTPVPPQTGLTNYVDNDAHTVSAGFGLTYPDPLNLDDDPITVEITAAYTILPDRTVVKQSASDPVGPYTHGGNILGFSFTVRHDF